ncbi:MAG: response regulator [Actinomycetota bacterium]|nr:response regulator [Actinomycetota bacterium]
MLARQPQITGNTAHDRERRSVGRRFIEWLAGLSLLRLITVFVLLGLLPLTLLIYYSLSVSSATVRREVKARIRAASTVTAELVEQEMRGVKTLVESYGDRPLLIEAMSAKGRDPHDQEVIATMSEGLRTARPGIAAAFVADGTGRLLEVAPPTPSIVGADFSFRDWYKGVTRTERPYVSEVYRSQAAGRPWVTAVAAPVLSDSGEVLGSIVAAYGADELQTFVDQFERSQGVSLTISDQNGVPVVDPGTMQTGPNLLERRAASAALRGSSGILEGTDDEGDALIAFSPVERIGWAVTATTPNSTAFASVSTLQSTVLIIGGLVALALSAQLVFLVLTLHEHRTVAKRLRDSEESSRMIVEAAGEAFVSIDDRGLITGWNRRSEEIFGWPRKEVVGKTLTETIIPEPYRKAHEDGIRHYLASGEGPVLNKRIELSALDRDGREFPIDLLIWPIKSSAGYSFNAFIQDITDRKKSQDELAAARDEALDASRSKSEFLANMSHEIRTPMNAVIGMTGLLLDDNSLSDEQRDHAETVCSAAESLLVIINDILDFSKIEAGAMQLEMVDFALEMVVENVAELLASSAHDKGLELVTWIESELPAAVSGDIGRLRQVLINLTGNAIKFTHDGEVTIFARVAEDTTAGILVRFEVSDTGIGIAEDARAGLFDAFSQADESTTRRYGGSGLGLAICKRLVDLMGGEIGVESEPGKGTRFWFTVPLETRPILESRVPRWDMRGVRALVVDDGEVNRRILIRQLASWGISSDQADGAYAALSMIEGTKEQTPPYDLVILDKEMPEMDGLELAAVIRQEMAPRSHLKKVAILLLTSSAHPPTLEELRRAGIGAAMTKPVRQSQLLDHVANLLDAPSTGGESPTVETRAAHVLHANYGPVLVAEDNPANQKVVRAMLRRLGYRADVVGNGLEAVDAAGRLPYAAIIMDCQMPEMDGYRAATEIRRREPNGAHALIIALTASAMQGDREKALMAGMDDYITKPVRMEELAGVLRRRIKEPALRLSNELITSPTGRAKMTETTPSPILNKERISYLEAEFGDKLITELFGSFLAQAPGKLTSLREAFETGDAGGIERDAHYLKGSSGNIGAARIEALCDQLEALGRSGDVRGASDLLARLEEGFEEVGSALVAANASWGPSEA